MTAFHNAFVFPRPFSSVPIRRLEQMTIYMNDSPHVDHTLCARPQTTRLLGIPEGNAREHYRASYFVRLMCTDMSFICRPIFNRFRSASCTGCCCESRQALVRCSQGSQKAERNRRFLECLLFFFIPFEACAVDACTFYVCVWFSAT